MTCLDVPDGVGLYCVGSFQVPPEEVNGCGNELRWGIGGHAAQVKDKPRILLTGAMRSLLSLSHEIRSWQSTVFDSPSRMKIDLMLALMAC
jgi:hypothetical protein